MDKSIETAVSDFNRQSSSQNEELLQEDVPTRLMNVAPNGYKTQSFNAWCSPKGHTYINKLTFFKSRFSKYI